MAEQNGMEKPDLQALPTINDRMTFLYLEHCKIHREDGAITARDLEGTLYIPAAAITVLLLGPGTDISHRAMELIGDLGRRTWGAILSTWESSEFSQQVAGKTGKLGF